MMIEVLTPTCINTKVEGGYLINQETSEKITDREIIKVFLNKIMDIISEECYEHYYVDDRISNLNNEGISVDCVSLSDNPVGGEFYKDDYMIIKLTLSGEDFYYSCEPEYSDEGIDGEPPTISYYSYTMLDSSLARSFIKKEIDRLECEINNLKSFLTCNSNC